MIGCDVNQFRTPLGWLLPERREETRPSGDRISVSAQFELPRIHILDRATNQGDRRILGRVGPPEETINATTTESHEVSSALQRSLGFQLDPTRSSGPRHGSGE